MLLLQLFGLHTSFFITSHFEESISSRVTNRFRSTHFTLECRSLIIFEIVLKTSMVAQQISSGATCFYFVTLWDKLWAQSFTDRVSTRGFSWNWSVKWPYPHTRRHWLAISRLKRNSRRRGLTNTSFWRRWSPIQESNGALDAMSYESMKDYCMDVLHVLF